MESTSRSAPLVERYLQAQLHGDRAEAVRLVLEEGLGAGMTVPQLYMDVVSAAQQRIGRLWQDNAISVAQEHLATAISQVVLATLYGHMPRRAPNGKTVLLACVQGETHEVGARIAADFMEMDGFRVRFLGADVPTEDLVEIVTQLRPDLVALSVTLSFHRDSLVQAVRQLRAAFPSLKVVIGGGAVAWLPNLASELGVDVLGTTAPECVNAARRLLGLEVHDG